MVPVDAGVAGVTVVAVVVDTVVTVTVVVDAVVVEVFEVTVPVVDDTVVVDTVLVVEVFVDVVRVVEVYVLVVVVRVVDVRVVDVGASPLHEHICGHVIPTEAPTIGLLQSSFVNCSQALPSNPIPAYNGSQRDPRGGSGTATGHAHSTAPSFCVAPATFVASSAVHVQIAAAAANNNELNLIVSTGFSMQVSVAHHKKPTRR